MNIIIYFILLLVNAGYSRPTFNWIIPPNKSSQQLYFRPHRGNNCPCLRFFIFNKQKKTKERKKMEKKKLLVNLSNHSSDKWSAEQKSEWDKIIDIPFPNIPLEADVCEVVAKYVTPIAEQLGKIVRDYEDEFNLYLCLLGEYTFCYALLLKIYEYGDYMYVIPTTARIVEEKINDDGTTEKISIFKFIRLRII